MGSASSWPPERFDQILKEITYILIKELCIMYNKAYNIFRADFDPYFYNIGRWNLDPFFLDADPGSELE